MRRRDTRGQSCIDQSLDLVIGVLTQQQAILDHVVDRALHPIVVVIERRIALLDRPARIAGGFAVGLGLGERDVLAGAFTAVVGLWPRRSPQPVYVARGTVTSGSRTPAMSLPSLSVFGTKLG